MRGVFRVVAGAVGALVLTAPVWAQSPSPSPDPPASAAPSSTPSPYAVKPTAVVVHLAGGYHPVNRWLAYDADGTARFEGTLDFESGQFRSRVDFGKVAAILADAEMCTRHGTLVRPATVGMDMRYYRVSVRCGVAWRTFTSGDAFEPDGVAQSRKAVARLEQLASSLKWERATDTAGPPDSGRVYFANPNQR